MTMLSSNSCMRHVGLVTAWTAILYLASPAQAWNATGHRAVAAIAYARLSPIARARVDELLRHHPDYKTLLTEDAPADAAGRSRAAFLAAAVWPDVIKGDPRFYDNLSKDARSTPLLPGFPDMGRHTNWHYVDETLYTPDGAYGEKQAPPNARTELERILQDISRQADDPVNPAYDLPWLLHLVGDLHQPLHTTSRFLKSQPEGDAGGNNVFIAPNTRLHTVWDNLAGTDTSDAYVTKYAEDVTSEHPAPQKLDLNIKQWMKEGFALAKSDVYTFGLETGSKEHPIQLSEAYVENAKRIARARIALAGYRLAAILNEKLK
jgi:hypothetical protein